MTFRITYNAQTTTKSLTNTRFMANRIPLHATNHVQNTKYRKCYFWSKKRSLAEFHHITISQHHQQSTWLLLFLSSNYVLSTKHGFLQTHNNNGNEENFER